MSAGTTASIPTASIPAASIPAASIPAAYGALAHLVSVAGGRLADRVLGSYRAALRGGILIACGHYAMAVPTAAPLITGRLGDQRSRHRGFSAAAIGMTPGLLQYVVGRHHHLAGRGKHATEFAPARDSPTLEHARAGGLPSRRAVRLAVAGLPPPPQSPPFSRPRTGSPWTASSACAHTPSSSLPRRPSAPTPRSHDAPGALTPRRSRSCTYAHPSPSRPLMTTSGSRSRTGRCPTRAWRPLTDEPVPALLEREGMPTDEYSATELADGVQVVDWPAAQPWCNSRVHARHLLGRLQLPSDHGRSL